ncbi:MAG: DUF5615 family PIN-like protein [Armatimonadota bacterium]
MRILADENVPGEAVSALRSRGHDVVWVRDVAPAVGDNVVVQRARDEDRIIITFDKDFGELAFRAGLPSSAGVILFRLALPSPEHAVEMIVAAIEARGDWAGHFAVIEEGRIRMTPLPGAAR